MARLKHVLLAAALAPLAVLAAVACDDGSDTGNSTSQGSIDAIEDRVQRNEMMVAALTLQDIQLHQIDESIAAEDVTFNIIPDTRTVVRVLALTDWPAELQADATTVHDAGVALLQALDNDDIEAAKEPARVMHEGGHDFGNAIWAIVAADLPPDAGGVEEEHEEEATPEAGATP